VCDDGAVLHPDLKAARFIPRFSWTSPLVRLIRRLPMPPVRVPAGITVTNRTTPGPDGAPDVRVRLYRPAGLPPAAPALLWLHGGGHLIGKPEQDDRTCLEFARRGVTVVSVDYRLSPEHPFPAALAQRAHDEGRIRLALQLLVYPMLDDRTVLRDDAAPADLRVWTPGSNRLGWASYLGVPPGSAAIPEYAVPARRTDLTGLPPAWIGVGTADLFHDECVAYARRLEEAGVPVTLDVVDGAFHGFDAVFRNASVTRRFIGAQVAALRETLGV